MLLGRTNIEEKLKMRRKKDSSPEDVLKEVFRVLKNDDLKEARIFTSLQNQDLRDTNALQVDQLSSDNIYHISHIKDICITYRLRFLDSHLFKGDIPYEAISKIKNLEKIHQTELNGFKIIAPSKLFKLKNADDPLLFVPIGNDYFYLVHKWGKDLNPLRKWLMWPFKSFENIVFTTLIVSFLATALVPNGLFSNNMGAAEFWMIFFFMFKSIAAVVIYYGFSAGKNFNTAIWDSPYYNA